MDVADNAGDEGSLPPIPPPTPRLTIPDSLLTIENVESALLSIHSGGLKPLLLHAPTADGGCTCGKKHDVTASGSSSAGKHPIQSNWSKATPTIDQLRDQLSRLKFVPNVGLILGRQPGTGEYLIAIDIDDAERFARLEKELGPLPETARCDSGRGYRLFYVAPAEIDIKRLVNVTGIGGEPGVDAKVEGGQVVVAPSLHANGKKYVWTRAGELAYMPVHWAMQLLKAPEEPQWVSEYTPKTLSEDKRARGRAERWLEVAVLGETRSLAACRQGQRNNTLFRTACMLFEKCAGVYLGHKWQWISDELLSAAKACGLADHESRRTIASADKTVRESGKVRVPVWLADPAPSRPPESAPSVPAPGELDDPQPITPSSDPWTIAPSSQRPVIKVSTELDANANAAISALCSEKNLYQREKRLVYVTHITRDESESSAVVPTDDGLIHRQLVEGTPHIHIMSRAIIKSTLSRVAVFQKWVESTGRWKPILPTDDIVGHVHDIGSWPGVRHLVGITETPTMRPDGTIVQEQGYDQRTGYLYLPNTSYPPIKDEMASQQWAAWALRELKDVFCDFPYVNEAHRMVPISAILTLVARAAIEGSVPAHLFDASTRGSGKTLQTDAIAIVATGRGAPRTNYTSDEIELEKILGGYALAGSPFICLDNVPVMRPFGGGPIDKCITARDKVALRILGVLRIEMLSWRALIMATGNNMSLYGDTARRSLMARLEPTDEKPEQRTEFKHSDLLKFITDTRHRLVSAALLMLRAYFLAGRPDMGCARWGSFEEWSRLVPHAIKFAGGADPMLARPESDEEVDNESRAIRVFMTRIREVVGEEPFRVSSIVELLYKSKRPRNENGDECDGFEDLRDAIESLVGRKGFKSGIPDAVELGKRIGAFRGRVIAGLRMTSKVGAGGILRWQIHPTSSPDLVSTT